MAKTYVAAGLSIALAATAKSLIGIINAHATRKVAIQKVWILNNQQAAVTGVLTQIALRKYSALTLGTGATVTPVAYDTTNVAVDLTSISCFTSGTYTEVASTEFRRFIWSADEPVMSSATMDELECIGGLNVIYESPKDTTVTPIILNTNEAIGLTQLATTSNVGTIDCFIEFTVY